MQRSRHNNTAAISKLCPWHECPFYWEGKMTWGATTSNAIFVSRWWCYNQPTCYFLGLFYAYSKISHQLVVVERHWTGAQATTLRVASAALHQGAPLGHLTPLSFRVLDCTDINRMISAGHFQLKKKSLLGKWVVLCLPTLKKFFGYLARYF